MSTQEGDGMAWVVARHLAVGDDSPGAAIVEGERRLMTAVLVNALRSLFQDAERPGRLAARRLRQELRWLTSADRAAVFSFERICESLELDAQAVRAHVLRHLGGSPRLAGFSPDAYAVSPAAVDATAAG
jgi:hypothetical protein